MSRRCSSIHFDTMEVTHWIRELRNVVNVKAKAGEPIIRTYGNLHPVIHERAWIAPGAAVIGDVWIGEDSSVWYGAVLRGDVHHVRVGARTNLQDQSTVHVTKDLSPTIIGDEVTVGHRAVVHGCTVRDGALIGIGAIVLDGATVGEGALVAAGALVAPGAEIEGGMLAVGIPAKTVRRLSDSERALQLERTLAYVENAREHALSEEYEDRHGEIQKKSNR